MLGEKRARLGYGRNPSTSIEDQIPMTGSLMHNILHPRTVYLLLMHERIEHRLPAFCLVVVLLLQKYGSGGRPRCSSAVRHVHVSWRVIADVIICIRA